MWVAAGPGLTVPSARGGILQASRAAVARARVYGRAELYALRGQKLVFVAHVDGGGRVRREVPC